MPLSSENIGLRRQTYKRAELTDQAKKSNKLGDPEKEKAFWLEATKLYLNSKYEVADLNLIEQSYLNNITLRVMAEMKEQEERLEALRGMGDDEALRQASASNFPHPEVEIAQRWLYELYGLNIDQIPDNIAQERRKEYIRFQRDKSNKI